MHCVWLVGGFRSPRGIGPAVLALGAMVACGARTPTPTRDTLPDASVDAPAPASIAGIACFAFEPTWMLSSPACDALDAPECEAWARAVLPSGYPVGGACDLGPGQCRFRGVFRALPCEPSRAGDDACRTFASQFVRTGGVPDARCEATTGGAGAVTYGCNFRCEVGGISCSPLTFEEPLRLCVWRGGARRCERPCE